MKILENISLFICSYCGKRYLRQGFCLRHESFCGSNPKNKPRCSECKHLRRTKEWIGANPSAMDPGRLQYGFYCIKHNQHMYPLKAIRLKVIEKYPKQLEDKILMPNECDDYGYAEEAYWGSLSGDHYAVPFLGENADE